MLTNLLYLIALLLGFPVGLLLFKLCSDEIKAWKKRLIIISGICLVLAFIISFTNFLYKLPVIMGLFFIIITCLVIVWKSE